MSVGTGVVIRLQTLSSYGIMNSKHCTAHTKLTHLIAEYISKDLHKQNKWQHSFTQVTALCLFLSRDWFPFSKRSVGECSLQGTGNERNRCAPWGLMFKTRTGTMSGSGHVLHMLRPCVQSGRSAVCNAFTVRDSTTSGTDDRPTKITHVKFCIFWHENLIGRCHGYHEDGQYSEVISMSYKKSKMRLGHGHILVAIKDTVEYVVPLIPSNNLPTFLL